MLSMMSTLSAATEMPTGSGFAEQFRDMSSSLISGPSDNAETELDTEAEVTVSAETAVETNQMTNLQSGCLSKTWSYCHVECAP